MALTDLEALRARLNTAEALMLEVRKNSALHGELTVRQEAVKKARAELKAYEQSHV